jgi:hypothetical protein
MAGSNNRHRVADEAEGSRAGAHRRQWLPTFSTIYLRFFLCFLRSSLLQVHSMEPVLCAGHESTSAGRLLGVGPLLSHALRGTWRPPLQGGAWGGPGELEDVSKKAGIAELEWEDQRKQLLATIDGIVLRFPLNPVQLLILITIVS